MGVADVMGRCAAASETAGTATSSAMAPELGALDEEASEADVRPGLGVAAGAIALPLAAAAAAAVTAAASPPPSAAGIWAPLRSLLTPLPFALLHAGAVSLPPGRARDAEADAAPVPHAAGVLLQHLGHRFHIKYSMMLSTYSSHASLGFEAASVVPRPGRAKEWPKSMSSLRFLMSIHVPSAR